jgi:hypothetical protein
MTLNDPVMESLFAALRMLNDMRPPDRQLPAHPETQIMGTSADLDSMDLVNLFLFAEESMGTRGLSPPSLIELATQMGEDGQPISISSLADRIRTAIEQSGGG